MLQTVFLNLCKRHFKDLFIYYIIIIIIIIYFCKPSYLGPVVQSPIRANPGLTLYMYVLLRVNPGLVLIGL